MDDKTGAVLGVHTGVHGFTVGQRHGLGIDAPAPDGRPRYVLALEPVSGTVRVGSHEELGVRAIAGTRPVWPTGAAPGGPVRCVAQVRAHGGTVAAVAEVTGDEVRVRLDDELRGVAPGQLVVLYRPDPGGDVVLGSARITGTG